MRHVILYDLDGVLVDAVKIHQDAFMQAVKAITGFGISTAYHDKYLNGLPTKTKLDILSKDEHTSFGSTPLTNFEREKIEALKQSITIDLINKQMFTDHAKRDLHKWAIEEGYLIGVVTNCSRDTAELMLLKTGQLDFIDVLITNKDVANPKPHPEPYLAAMQKLNVTADQCLVVEDTLKGKQAGEAALCKVLFVSGPDDVSIQNIRSAMSP